MIEMVDGKEKSQQVTLPFPFLFHPKPVVFGAFQPILAIGEKVCFYWFTFLQLFDINIYISNEVDIYFFPLYFYFLFSL